MSIIVILLIRKKVEKLHIYQQRFIIFVIICQQLENCSIKKRRAASQAPVVHACHPSYSGGRDQEDLSSKPDWVNSL
jgi:hypothetical protein